MAKKINNFGIRSEGMIFLRLRLFHFFLFLSFDDCSSCCIIICSHPLFFTTIKIQCVFCFTSVDCLFKTFLFANISPSSRFCVYFGGLFSNKLRSSHLLCNIYNYLISCWMCFLIGLFLRWVLVSILTLSSILCFFYEWFTFNILRVLF